MSYSVSLLTLSSGERFPILCSRVTGIPLLEPNTWCITQLRGANRASATMKQALRSVMVLQLILDDLKIDLTKRLAEGHLLSLGEIEAIVTKCGQRLINFQSQANPQKVSLQKIINMRPTNSKKSRDATRIKTDSANIRLIYIYQYLHWRITQTKLTPAIAKPSAFSYEMADTSLKALGARIPAASYCRNEKEREGLAENHRSLLEQVIKPQSNQNPWKDGHAKIRNELIVRWLLELGVRRGELLNVRISNINFQSNEVFISRCSDDPNDQRKHQPNTKTKARMLTISDELVRMTINYVREARRINRNANKHDFLFVANDTGDPLSLSAVNKLFDVLRRNVPDLPQQLFPHVLRHTWNDDFSALMDEAKVEPAREQQIRSRLMGWSETSGTAATYTKRHIRKKAKEASLALQAKLKNRAPKNERPDSTK